VAVELVPISPAKSRSRCLGDAPPLARSLKSGCRIRAYLEPPHEPSRIKLQIVFRLLWDTIHETAKFGATPKGGVSG